jgi:hypothetical protein
LTIANDGANHNAQQKFDFSFEEEDAVDGMKRLIVDEVNSFRAEVRRAARGGASQVRRQDSLPVPTRDEIIASPAVANDEGHTSSFAANPAGATQGQERSGSPMMEDPGAALERELAGSVAR